jgi:replication initiation and membrane attachment protein DnaB
MGNKTMRFELRLTAKEKETLKRKAKKYGMTPSELVRHTLIHSDDLSINVIDIVPLRKMAFEIHKHGVNLNQLMKFLNTYGLDAFNENRVIPILENERAVFLEAKAALRSLEEEARARNVIVSLEMPDDEEDESEDL